ncbi:DUF4440 domain-containing protein [Kineosporia sp. NBRC 101731]|uniref:YybH family protein n=1 Tax=Kineosporia sp. NBRC 101731 TaxID=3032199 RepID=UPI0024A57908|nr:DUF4440 domain-containing protein [Kineosporia sp. NBRC 101731]GLY32345.1 hypothetical protein Kisp02_57100 [Kineosporia sp. NBRC 101731]
MSAHRPHDLPAVFAAAFNSGDQARLEPLYEPTAILVPQPGLVLSGEQRRAGTAAVLGRGLPITTTLRHVLAGPDIALLISDFRFDGTGPNGQANHARGVATDVARRAPDGTWRYVISWPQEDPERPGHPALDIRQVQA